MVAMWPGSAKMPKCVIRAFMYIGSSTHLLLFSHNLFSSRQECPQCSAYIEKAGGCNWVKCYKVCPDGELKKSFWSRGCCAWD